MMEWKIVRWEEVLTIKNGKNQKKVVNPNGAYPIYGSGGVMGYADSYLCPEGTTIIGRKGSINKPIYVAEKFWNVDTAFGLCVGEKLDKKFFFYFCKTYNFLQHNKATTLPSLTKTDLLRIKIPLPPLPTQKRIAKILDEADRVRLLNRRLLEHYDALAGALFLDMFGDPVKNEKGWEIVKMGDICHKITDGTHQSPKFLEEGIPFLLVSNIVNNVLLYKTKKFISEEAYKKLTKSTPIEKGDLLYTSVGSYGNPAIVKEGKRFCFQRHIAHLKPNHELINVEFLHAMMLSPLVKRQADKYARGVAQKTLNLKVIKEMLVFLPPLSLQNQVATRIEAIEAQKTQAKAALEKSEALFASLLQSAFKGELIN